MKYGIFVNPTPKSLSDLQNDNNYMAIKEYVLNSDVLSGSTAIAINDLKAGSTIVKMSLHVRTPFVSTNISDTIEVSTDTDKVLLAQECNDPNRAGDYSSDCYYITSGNQNEILVHHTLSNMTAGVAILKIKIYENIPEYEELTTSDNTVYTTKDNVTTEVNK